MIIKGHKKVFKIIGMTIGGIILAVVMAFLLGYIVMLLWNWLMPDLFGLKEISFWQAWGLFLLAKILFGNFKMVNNHKHKEENIEGPCRMPKPPTPPFPDFDDKNKLWEKKFKDRMKKWFEEDDKEYQESSENNTEEKFSEGVNIKFNIEKKD